MFFSTLSTLTHGILDYTTALTLAVLPRAIGASPKVTNLMQGAAVAHAGYALLTDYEVGAVKAIPMKGHLLLDGLGAAGFIAAAALMDDEDTGTRALLAGLGVYELTATLLTQTKPSNEARYSDARMAPNYHPQNRAGLRQPGPQSEAAGAYRSTDDAASSRSEQADQFSHA